MIKKNPFLLSALIFGGIAATVFIIAALSFLGKDTTVVDTICRIVHLSSNNFDNGTLAEIACILALPAFLFGLKAFTDSESEP